MTLAIVDQVERARIRPKASTGSSDEAGLLAEAKAGNASAFDELFQRHERRIFGIAYRITRNREDAEDVVQESFHRAFLYLGRFRGDSTFSSWLTRIGINEALMTIRRRRHNTVSINDLTNPDSDAAAIEMEDSRPTPEQQCAQLELRSALIDSVLQLRPSLRAAILLHEFRDFSTAETAHLLGISVSAAKVRLFYARSKLREDLGPRLSLRSTRSRESDFVATSSSGITEMAALPTGQGV